MVWGWTTLKRHLVGALGLSDHKTVQAGKAEKCKNKSIWKSRKFDCVALGRQMLPSKECSSKLWYLIKFYQSLFISSVKFFVLWRLLKVTWYVSHVVIKYTQLEDTKFHLHSEILTLGFRNRPKNFDLVSEWKSSESDATNGLFDTGNIEFSLSLLTFRPLVPFITATKCSRFRGDDIRSAFSLDKSIPTVKHLRKWWSVENLAIKMIQFLFAFFLFVVTNLRFQSLFFEQNRNLTLDNIQFSLLQVLLK